ncbi:MAG: response regulator receiver protein [Myxococcales bacterium]|jgi:two-component system cell cycle response regulator DivK|nr:response regulator receiver protein [Myxococcales bacterium]
MPKADETPRDVVTPVPRVPRARILVVEDNPLNRLLVHDILELRGHTVVEAATVDEARAALDREPPELLLLDVQIPGGGGEAVIREVRRRPQLAHLPIVAVTSLAMPGDRERLLGIGFQGYLSKPIDTRTFGAAVESYLVKSAEPEKQVEKKANARQIG